ncbi:actin-related protein 6 isoform X2 [Daktulosphaira vitifoliae]|uniref:actin-related protein 6 isoform X2 n=1 Tax=Daktulosphaira vitifoliae TaxID=58002 RepID=UPI0021AB095F|nr:actin-related protein 6 isoform X2 [Daktulosphaira vitifoliae]
MTAKCYILDNGAYTAKVGHTGDSEPLVIPNYIMKVKSERRRTFIGDQLKECRDKSGLFYMLGYQKGYLLNWDIQKTVWDYVFSKECCKADFTETPLIVTEPYFNFSSIQEGMTEMFFEEYEFQSLLRINAGDLSCYHYHQDNKEAKCCLVVETGYSFTHIVPYILQKKFKPGILRINVGDVMEETYVMNQVKEDMCFVSTNFNQDMKISKTKWPKNTIVRDYVLPDYTTVNRGFVRTLDETGGALDKDNQILRLSNERFTIPEILFHPSDIGIDQMGIPEAIVHSINMCPEEVRPHLFNNIIVTGGSACFPGFEERLTNDIRALTPDEFDITITIPKNPITYAWHGGDMLSNDSDFYSLVVSKEEYDEEGFSSCLRFDV